MLGAASRPREAGLVTSTLPAASWRAASPSWRAVSSTNLAAAVSLFEHRGIRESCSEVLPDELGLEALDGLGHGWPSWRLL